MKVELEVTASQLIEHLRPSNAQFRMRIPGGCWQEISEEAIRIYISAVIQAMQENAERVVKL